MVKPQSDANVTVDEVKAIVDEAHRSGVRVAAHAIGDKATRIAAEAGVDSIEHAYVVPDDVLRMMVEKHIFLVPTDGTLKTFVDMSLGSRQSSNNERAEREKEFAPFVQRRAGSFETGAEDGGAHRRRFRHVLVNVRDDPWASEFAGV